MPRAIRTATERDGGEAEETVRPAPRRDGAAQRPADPRPDLLGRRGAGSRRRDPGRLRAASRCSPPTSRCGCRCCAGPLRLAEAFLLIPMVRMKLRVGAAPVRGRAGDRRDAGRLEREPGAAPPARRAPPGSWSQAALGLAPAMVALSDRNLAAYHGVEHKAIGAYEAGLGRPGLRDQGARALRLQPGRADAACSRRPASCCSSARWRSPARSRGRRSASPARRVAAEMFAWSERNPETTAARAFHRPGHEIQRLIATKEPTPEQLEVGVAALREILRVEQEAERRGRGRAIRSPLRRLRRPCSAGSTTSASPPTTSTGALALYEGTLGMPLAHRETVESQGVEAALLDVGDGHVELLRPARPGHAGRQVPRASAAPACITSPTRSATSTTSWTSSRTPASS